MKKVIRGRLYDTDTAQLIAERSGGGNSRDFSYWEENMYRKKTGEYFLYCYGGPLSQYASHFGTSSGYGEDIRPLTFSEAREWAEMNMDGDGYIAEFGEPVEDYSRKSVTFSIKASNAEMLKKKASETGKSMSQLVDELIEKL